MWQKIKRAFAGFMAGRHGSDQLSMATLLVGLAFSLIGSFTGLGIVSLLGTALYIYTIFRIFSRNNTKRSAENMRYLNFTQSFTTNVRQAFKRLRNSKDYKYFKCPQCKAWLRIPRKKGEVTVTCGRCKNRFKMKS